LHFYASGVVIGTSPMGGLVSVMLVAACEWSAV